MRSKPNARPYAEGGTAAASNALRPGVRSPRPSHAVQRAAIRCKALVANAMRARRRRREHVRRNHQRLAPVQPVGPVARGKFGEAGKPVGRAFDRAQPARPRAQRDQQPRQHRRRHLVRPVASQTGQPRAQHGTI